MITLVFYNVTIGSIWFPPAKPPAPLSEEVARRVGVIRTLLKTMAHIYGYEAFRKEEFHIAQYVLASTEDPNSPTYTGGPKMVQAVE